MSRDEHSDKDVVGVLDRKMNDSTMPPPKTSNILNLQTTTSSSKHSSTSSVNAASESTSTAIQIPAPRYTTNSAIASAKPSVPRRKQGFGLSDWNRLVSSSKDLALRNGAPMRRIGWKEIRQHSSPHDGWIVLKNKVYFISPYLAYHPGGEKILKSVLGKDASILYNKYHQWVNEEGLIGKLHIGYLDTSQDDDSDSEGDDDHESPLYLPSTT